ncbi:MAG: IS110 family transposase [Arcicella sp.]|nr:IS110 family transposase [Arcicella sp.]
MGNQQQEVKVPQIEFEQIVLRGCGIDVHSKNIVATIDGQGLPRETRTFDSFTGDLRELSSWLRSHEITHVAMESTGVYWKPVFNILGEDFTVLLVNARHLKNVPGRKTDKKDSEWICKLLLSGLLNKSYVPPETVRELRDLNRYAIKLTQQHSAEINRIQKILEDANIKLSEVVSDVEGKKARKMIQGLILGEQSVEDIVSENYHKKLKASKETLIKALTGRVTPHHKFMLTNIYAHMDYLEKQIEVINVEMDRLLTDSFDAINLLATIPGVGLASAKKIIAELGTDMSHFPSEKHLSKWAGMAPGNNESGGKKKVQQPLMATNI